MKRTIVPLAAIVFCAVGLAYADYRGYDRGAWPQSWPKELEALRKQARTLVGPEVLNRHYQIPFTKREEFEAAWPHLLKVKSKGAPIILVRGPKTDFFEIRPAGVLIHSPPADSDPLADPEEPIPGERPVRSRWSKTTFIELVVDGNIVDLNRIALPADTPIVDERFKNCADRIRSSRVAVEMPITDWALSSPGGLERCWKSSTPAIPMLQNACVPFSVRSMSISRFARPSSSAGWHCHRTNKTSPRSRNRFVELWSGRFVTSAKTPTTSI